MKKITLIMAFFLTLTVLQAQDYEIGFTSNGTGTISSVSVENLTQGTAVTLNGDDVLHLLLVTTGVEQVINQNSGLRVYPNPMTETSSIEFNATVSGLASISVFDITGKQVISEQRNLGVGSHVFKLNNLSTGIYTLSVKSESYEYSSKLVSQNETTGNASLSYESTSALKSSKSVKGKKATVEMQYNDNENLKITGISSEGLIREIELTPTADETVTFDFTLMLGDYAEGGVVFYLNDTGGGLVCAVKDQADDNGVAWSGNTSTSVAGATSDTDGAANTAAIVADNNTADKAATLCKAYNGGDFHDWFLPSKDRLADMYTNRDAINTTATLHGGSDFDVSGYSPTYSVYWSSTEYSSHGAWYYIFSHGNSGHDDKIEPSRVRAVRAF